MYCSLQMPRIARSINYKKGTQELEGRRILTQLYRRMIAFGMVTR